MASQNHAVSAWDIWAPTPSPAEQQVSLADAPEDSFVPPEKASANEPVQNKPPTEASLPEEPSPKRKPAHWQWALAGTLSVFLLLALTWTFGSLYFSKFTLGNKTMYTRLSDSTLASLIDTQAKSYKLTVSYPGKTQTSFTLKDIGVAVDTTATIQGLRGQQHQLKNRFEWWSPMPINLKTKVNYSVLNKFISKHITLITQPAKDASLSISSGKVMIKDASTGKEYGLENALQTIVTHASTLQTTPIKLKTLALTPAVTAASLASSKSKLEKTLGQSITFSINGQIITASPSDIAAWLDISKNKSGTVDITVNSGKVQDYIESIAANYIHPPRAQVNINKNGKISTLVKGESGTDVTNKSDVATSVAKQLLSGQSMSLSLSVSHAPYKTITAGNYSKWIEVDLTNRRLYAYERNKLVYTALTSDGRPDTPTVVGQFAIYKKFASQDMRGANVDGSSYYQPNVPWINYFYKDYAIHGNYWRPTSYFGNVDSSHGCVGVIPSVGAWIYSWAPIGTPIITHY